MQSSPDQAIAELERAVDLSPNFALGHSALRRTVAVRRSGAAITASTIHRSLSPFDSLLFGMLGARTMTPVRLEQYQEAAEWAAKPAARTNTPQHNPGDRRALCALPGRVDEGKTFAAMMPLAAYLQRGGLPGYLPLSARCRSPVSQTARKTGMAYAVRNTTRAHEFSTAFEGAAVVRPANAARRILTFFSNGRGALPALG
jgi:hypothetical protein